MKKPEEKRTIPITPRFNEKEFQDLKREQEMQGGLSFASLIMKMIKNPLKDAIFVGDRVGGSIVFNNKIWRPVDD